MRKRRLFRYENKHQPVLARKYFIGRFLAALGFASLLVGASLVAGMAGYHYLEGQYWIDAFANAAMILSGMGPLAPLQTIGGKVFAGLYALYSGLLLILATGIVLAPVVHRICHRFHVGADES